MDSHDVDDQEPCQATPVWSLLDRSDPAWKALYSLYNPDNQHGRAAGLQFSQVNRQAIQHRMAARATAAAAAAATERAAAQQTKPSPKKRVAVPHFRPRSQEAAAPLEAVPRRRSGHVIQTCMAAEAERTWGQVPLPSGRLIDEQEKQRCALLMQFKGSIPNASQLTPTGQARIAALRARSSTSGGSSSAMPQADAVPVVLAAQRAALQGRFQEVEHEIAEREEFVATMQRLGKLQPEQMHAMRAEAAGKVQEMRQLDAEIKDLDAELRADYDRLAGTAS